jgi:hypothetical protein
VLSSNKIFHESLSKLLSTFGLGVGHPWIEIETRTFTRETSGRVWVHPRVKIFTRTRRFSDLWVKLTSLVITWLPIYIYTNNLLRTHLMWAHGATGSSPSPRPARAKNSANRTLEPTSLALEI